MLVRMGEATRSPRMDLRGAARDAVRDQVAESALRLFDERGFEATTVDDVARAVGISPRSFFRYFTSKEDAVVGDPMPYGRLVSTDLAARPADEPPWDSLRAALQRLVDDIENDRGMLTMRVVMSSPSLRARHLEKHLAWGQMFEPEIVERIAGPATTRRLRANALIHAAFACLDAAFGEWVALERARTLSDLLDEAFDTLR